MLGRTAFRGFVRQLGLPVAILHWLLLCGWLFLALIAATAAQAQSITDIRARVENLTGSVTSLYCGVFYPQQGYATSTVGFRYGNPTANSATNCGQPTARSGVQIAPAQPGAFTPGQYVPIAVMSDFNNPVFVGAGGPAAGPVVSTQLLLSVMGSPPLSYNLSKHETPNNGSCAYGPQITDCYDRITVTPANETETAAFIASDGNAYTLNIGGVAPLTGGVCPAAPTRSGTVYYDVPERASTEFCVYARISPVNAIRIIKSASPAAPSVDFSYTATQSGGTATAFPASFTLNGANSTTTSEIIRTYAGGTITIREAAQAGWRLTNLTCTASDGNLSGVTFSTANGVTLTNLPTGSTNRVITCTFANTQNNPQMVVEKTVTPTTISAPGTLTYAITLRNTGNVPLTGLALTDSVTQGGATLASPTPSLQSGDTNSNSVFDAGEVWTYRVTYAATQANIDSGGTILNTVSVRSTELPTAQTAQAVTSISANPAMSITKTTAQTSVNAVGQVITYDIRVANRGNVSLAGITLADAVTQGGTSRATPATTRLSGDTDSDNLLDVGETWVYRATYTVTQADLNDGRSLLNTATVTSSTAGAATQSATASSTVAASPALSVSKTAAVATVSAPGPVSYTITVRNEGNVTLTGVALADTLTRGNGSTATLTPTRTGGDTNSNNALDVGETWTYSASYAVTQADLNDGRRLSNAVSVTSAQTPTPLVDTAVVTMTQQPAYTLTKTVTPDTVNAPGTLTYEIRIANSGNVALTNLAISDQVQVGSTAPRAPTTGPTRTGGDTNSNNALDVGETWIYAATFTVTQAMITSGQPITNRVETGFDQITERRIATATTVIQQNFGMIATKTVDLASISAPGTLTYTVTLRNFGNSDLTGIALTDTMTQGGTNLPAGVTLTRGAAGNGDQILDVGETWTYSGPFAVTQAHIDNGGRLENTVSATSTETPTPVTASARTQITQSPAYSLEKTVDPVATSAPGTLAYAITIRNEGNVSLDLPMSAISDTVALAGTSTARPVTLVSGDAAPTGRLDAGETWVLSASFDLTQAMIDAGDPARPSANSFDVVNTATATARFNGDALIRSDIATTTVTRNPALAVQKTVDQTTIAAPGVLNYTITLTNSGNTALGNVSLDDRLNQNGTEALPSSGPTRTAGDTNGNNLLDVGESWTYQAGYQVTQEAIDAGGTIRNDVTVSTAQTAPATASAATTIQSGPAMSVDKTVDNEVVTAPGPLTYTITVRNTGNVTLRNIVLSDNLVPTSAITPDPTGLSLAVGQVRRFTATYQVTQAQVNAGGLIVNTVTASADGLPADAAQDSATSRIEQNPLFQIDKTVDRTSLNGPSPLIYHVTVTNTGNVTIDGCALTDRVTQDSTNGATVNLAVTQPACGPGRTALQPGESWDWDVNFTVTQAMIDRGTAITNTATFDADNVAPASAQAVTVLGRNADFSFEKSVSATTVTAPGPLTYTITARNSGNVTLTSPVLTDAELPNLTGPSGDDDGDGEIDVGETWVWTGTRQVTQAMIDAGDPISNSASLNTDQTLPKSDEVVTQIQRNPAASLTKTVSPNSVSAPGPVTYTIRAENTGNVRLPNAAVSDPMIPVGAPDSGDNGNGRLDIGEIWQWSLSYQITQEMIDSGSPILNTATLTADGISPQTDRARVNIVQEPGLALIKSGALQDANGNGRADAGERIAYDFRLRNTGNVVLRQVAVTDPALNPPQVGTVAQIAPGASEMLSASYVLTQADIDRGSVTNSAVGQGQTDAGGTVRDTSGTGAGNDNPTVVDLPSAPGLSLDKRLAEGEEPTYTRLGRIINYEFVVTNTGNVTLAGPVVVTDSLTTTPVCPAGDLLPGQQIICRASQQVSQDDLDRGVIENSATAAADGQTATDDLTILGVERPQLGLEKSSDHSGAFASGVEVTYSYRITNGGNQTISGPITVDDNKISGAIACLPAGQVLLPGNSQICSADYTITTADALAGSVTNLATATGQGPDGAVVSPPASFTIPSDTDPALTLSKAFLVGGATHDSLTYAAVGAEITYRFTVQNTGNTDMFGDLVVRDVTLGQDLTCVAGTTGQVTLAMGDEVTCDLAYAVTQEDIDRGSLTNTAYASASVSDDGVLVPVTSPQASATATAAGAPALGLAKLAEPASGGQLGDLITFTVTVTNNGNQTLRDIRVSDPMLADFACPSVPAVLVPGGNMECTGTWRLTQADIDAGEVENIATASGFAPPPPTGGNGTALSGEARVTHVTVDAAPALELSKTATFIDGNGDGLAQPGEQVEYVLTVTNPGNVTLRNVVVEDPMLSASPLLTLAALDPGASQSLVRRYDLTREDIDQPTRRIDNTATVSAQNPAGDPVDAPPAEASVTLPGQSSIEMVKTGVFVDLDSNGRANAGDRMDYVFAITNSGSVTLQDITVTDAREGVVLSGSPLASLAPGATDRTITGSYELTQEDVDRATLTNDATVTATDPGGDPVTDEASHNTNLEAVGALRLEKSGSFVDADGNGVTNAGDRIDYELTVTNTGTLTLAPVVVTDPVVSLNRSIARMAPGASQTLVESYVLSQADIDRGERENLASATGRRPNGTEALHDAYAQVPLAQSADFTLTKDAAYQDSNSDGRISAGDEIIYRMILRNTGAVTLNNIELSDPLLGGVISQTGVLEPQQEVNILGEYVLLQADIDAGSVTNNATARTVAPGGAELTREATVTTPLDTPPAMAVTKTADQAVIGQGGTIGYTITVENTGAVSLRGIDLEDRLRQNDEVVAELAPTLTDRGDGDALLAPGEIWTWRASHAVSQGQIDDGGDLVNRVRVTAANNPQAVNAEALTEIEAVTGLDLVKTASAELSDPPQPGDVVTYRFRITNTGQQLLRNIQLGDPMEGLVLPRTTRAQLPPGRSIVLTGTYELTQEDIDRGQVSNQAVITANRPDGTDLTDLSGLEPVTDAPTVVPLDPEAELLLVKTMRHDDANGDGAMNLREVLVYSFSVHNAGNVVLRNISVSDPMLAGGPFGTIASLAPGETQVIPATGSHRLTRADLEAGEITNTATATGTRPDGLEVSGTDTLVTSLALAPEATDDERLLQQPGSPVVIDVLENDSAASGRVLDPASVRIEGAPGNGRRLLVEGQGVWTVDPASGAITFTPEAGFDGDPDPIRYSVADENGMVSNIAGVSITYGRVGLELENEIVDHRDLNGNGITDAGDIAIFQFTVTNTGNTPLTGVTVATTSLPMPDLVCEAVDLAPGESVVLRCTGAEYVITEADVDRGEIVLVAEAAGDDPWGEEVTDEAETAEPIIAPVDPSLVLTKRALLSRVTAGQLVPFVITVENTEAEQRAIIDLVDTLPEGFLYQKGSGEVDGRAVEPRQTGARVIFEDLEVEPGETIEVALSAFVPGSVQPGEYVNRVVAVDAVTGRRLGNEARATVTVDADPVFDCGTVIGRVFHDRNGDGYPQAGEEGIGGVRLATVRGLFVTTDPYGRFHLPCPDLPRDIGSNFVLKLDPSSLPADYAVTSENPRVIRLTAGKMTDASFGAAPMQLVQVELAAEAFAGDAPIPALRQGLQDLVAAIATRPSRIRLNYSQGSDGKALATERLNVVTRLIRQIWPPNATYAPKIEAQISRLRTGN